jgi:hypothetical protein
VPLGAGAHAFITVASIPRCASAVAALSTWTDAPKPVNVMLASPAELRGVKDEMQQSAR